ncbi:hydrophobic protein [Kitasatospora aureofaciens]|uniref:hydrophobic protein n=1 Tax=Kitasatospora aureofaciens TaxID=1894 RepID=UPI000AB95031|nr:hydrophobic protein [Kitasatospora aureofaciens]
MLPLVLVLLPAQFLFGAGFAVRLPCRSAVGAPAARLLGSFARGTTSAGSHGRRFRW